METKLANSIRIGEFLIVKEEEVPPGRKTKCWLVSSTRGETLGRVKWFGRWRQYTFGLLRQPFLILDA